MAKLTSQQRDYFKDRIDDQFNNHLGPLEKVAAIKKAELVDEKFESFIAELGLAYSLDELAKIEVKLQSVQQTIATHMENLKEQYDMPSSNYGKKDYKWSWNVHEGMVNQVMNQLRTMCQKECEIAFKSIPEGQQIEELKNKKREALDYIYGYDQQKELQDGLAKVLMGSGVKMLEKYEVKS